MLEMVSAELYYELHQRLTAWQDVVYIGNITEDRLDRRDHRDRDTDWSISEYNARALKIVMIRDALKALQRYVLLLYTLLSNASYNVIILIGPS
jgi:hypothetical protein